MGRKTRAWAASKSSWLGRRITSSGCAGNVKNPANQSNVGPIQTSVDQTSMLRAAVSPAAPMRRKFNPFESAIGFIDSVNYICQLKHTVLDSGHYAMAGIIRDSKLLLTAPKHGSRSLPKKLIFRSIALVLGLLAGLLCAELGFRALNIRPERHAQPHYLVLDNGVYKDFGVRLANFKIKRRGRFAHLGVGMGEYVPGVSFKAVYASNPRGYFDSDNGVPFHINTLGLRGPEISDHKPEGTFRILVLGDSFTFGAGVRDEDTFVRRLEQSLNRKSNSKNFEVLNAGVEGYNTRDEVIYLEHQWLKLDPDLVLIGFYLNDAYPDLTFAASIRGLYLGVSEEQPYGMAQYSYLWDYTQHAVHTTKLRKVQDEFYRKSYFSHPKEFLENQDDVQVDWSVCREALKRAVDITRARNIRIALVVFPEFYKLDGGYPFENIHKLVTETCESLSLPACDLLEVYRGKRADRLWVHVTDHHPNELAHQLAAQDIEDFLRGRAILQN